MSSSKVNELFESKCQKTGILKVSDRAVETLEKNEKIATFSAFILVGNFLPFSHSCFLMTSSNI